MKYQLPIIQELKAVKNKKEIVNIIRAQRVNEKVLVEAVKKLKVGATEIDLARFIVSRFKYYKIKALAFAPIVAFGKNTADIHHEPSQTSLKKGDWVMLDFGATVNGYCSDMTRTYILGQPTAKQKKVYNTVLQAQQLAERALARGVRQAGKVDAVARKLINRKFGRFSFGHGLGHGVRMVIHEWPSLRPGSVDVLQPNMVVTLEPGVYLKGWGGVRIEDMVVVEERGIKNLTRAAKDIMQIVLKV